MIMWALCIEAAAVTRCNNINNKKTACLRLLYAVSLIIQVDLDVTRRKNHNMIPLGDLYQ